MWKWIKSLFGFSTPAETTPAPKKTVRPAVTRTNIRRSDYYRRGNNFYYYDDDSLIEDLILLDMLTDIFAKAAGGLVVKDGKILMIHRLG